MTAAHTPGRLAIMGSRDTTALELVQEAMPHMRVCFMTSDGPSLANARRIAKCWNAHDELVAALRALLRDIGDVTFDGQETDANSRCCDSISAGYAALAKVQP